MNDKQLKLTSVVLITLGIGMCLSAAIMLRSYSEVLKAATPYFPLVGPALGVYFVYLGWKKTHIDASARDYISWRRTLLADTLVNLHEKMTPLYPLVTQASTPTLDDGKRLNTLVNEILAQTIMFSKFTPDLEPFVDKFTDTLMTLKTAYTRRGRGEGNEIMVEPLEEVRNYYIKLTDGVADYIKNNAMHPSRVKQLMEETSLQNPALAAKYQNREQTSK